MHLIIAISFSLYLPSGAAPLHPMDCTDIVIGTARGGRFRVFDYYTRDRSTPQMDGFYSGTQDIVGSVGREENGITEIKFWKKLTSSKFIASLKCYSIHLLATTFSVLFHYVIHVLYALVVKRMRVCSHAFIVIMIYLSLSPSLF